MISKDLVLKAINKDSDAITKIYQDTYKNAYALAFSITKNKEDAEDMLQEAYISAFNNIDKLKNQDGFDTWFNQIVANRCKNYLVKKKPALFSSMGNEENDGFDISKAIEEQREEFQPEDTTETNEIKEIVSSMLDELPEDQKLCMIMFYGQDMKIKEISHALSISENTVKSRLMYGRKKMLELVKEKESKGYILRSVVPVSIFAVIPIALSTQNITIPASAGILSSIGVSSVVSTAVSTTATSSTVVSTTAAVAGKTVMPLFSKIIIGVVGVAVLGTGAIGTVKLINNSDTSETDNINISESVIEESSTEKEKYDFSIIDGFPDKLGFSLSPQNVGLGATYTKLDLDKSGNFSGETYGPDLTKCEIEGKFYIDKKVDDYTYVIKHDGMTYDAPGEKRYVKGKEYTTIEPFGFEKSDDDKLDIVEHFELYLPGKDINDIPQEARGWIHGISINGQGDNKLPYYVICNRDMNYAFVAY